MTNWLGKILNIRPSEWTRLLSIAFVLVISCLGTVWAQSASYATFVKEVGQNAIIWVQVFSSILSIPFMFIYTAFVDRVDNNRLFAYIIAIGAVIKLFGITLSAFITPAWAFLTLYILTQVWLAAWNAQFATYVNDLFDIQASKRTWPIILASASIASIVGGFTLQYLTGKLATSTFIWFWFITDILAFGTLWVMPLYIKGHKKFVRPASLSRKEESSYLQGTKEGFAFTIQSALLRWIAIGTLIMMSLMALMEYYYNFILAGKYSNPADYAGFLGKLEGVSGLVGLVILFFGVGWMTRVWGVKNTNLIFPLLNLVICLGLVGVPVYHAASLAMASLAFISRSGLRAGIQETIDALLFNAVPLRVKGRARAFVGGIVTPLGTLSGALLLWALSGAYIPLRVVIGLLALVYFISAFVVRHQYTQALVKMLEEEDYSFLLSESASKINIADPAALGRLQKKLEESATHEMRVFMTQLIAQVGGVESLPILIPAIKSAEESRTRAAMLGVVSAAGIQGAKARELYESYLTDADARVRQSAAAGLEQLLGAKDTWLQSQWLNMIEDADPQVSLYALQSLAGTGDFYKFQSATAQLDRLLKSSLVEDKKNAIDVLGMIARPKSIEHLLLFLEDENDQIRLEAVLDLEKLTLPFGDPVDGKIIEQVQPLLRDPMARIRQAALQVIGKFKDRKIQPLLISALTDKSPQVRASAIDILVELGKDASPLIQAELSSADSQSRKMAAVALSRINPRQFGSLIEGAVSDNLNNIYQNVSLEQALTPYANRHGVRIQLAALRESNHALIDEILYLLSAIHPQQILDVIGESLHSDSSETRNLALEALESLTSPKTAALIASLFEPSLAPTQLLQLGQGVLNVEQVDIAQALEKLLSQSSSDIHDLLSVHVVKDVSADLLQVTDSAEGSAPKSALTPQIITLLEKAAASANPLVRKSAQEALEILSVPPQTVVATDIQLPETLSVIEKMSRLKEVPFFRNIPVSQLENLAEMCGEKRYKKGERIFKAGDPGGSLYVVIRGQISIEQEKRGGSALLATLGDNSYFGEMSLFDKSPRSTSAVAAADSLMLELNRAPIFTLTMQSPDLALELINVLSQRIKETSDRLADAARSRPRELHKLFDQFN